MTSALLWLEFGFDTCLLNADNMQGLVCYKAFSFCPDSSYVLLPESYLCKCLSSQISQNMVSYLSQAQTNRINSGKGKSGWEKVRKCFTDEGTVSGQAGVAYFISVSKVPFAKILCYTFLLLQMTVKDDNADISILCPRKYHVEGILEQWFGEWAVESDSKVQSSKKLKKKKKLPLTSFVTLSK